MRRSLRRFRDDDASSVALHLRNHARAHARVGARCSSSYKCIGGAISSRRPSIPFATSPSVGISHVSGLEYSMTRACGCRCQRVSDPAAVSSLILIVSLITNLRQGAHAWVYSAALFLARLIESSRRLAHILELCRFAHSSA